MSDRTHPPHVSVIMPVYNTERYVSEAVESVLAQTDVSLELICIDDGSTDASRAYIERFGPRVELIESVHNEGIGAARNRGLAGAQGTYIAFMDADDVWLPGKLAAQCAHLDTHPEHDIVFTHLSCFLSPDLSSEVRALRYCDPTPTPGVLPPTALIRAEAFSYVGSFNPAWRVGEFVDWLARAQSAGLRYHVLPEVYLQRRIHATNTGVTERPSRIDYVRIVKAALDRKRNRTPGS